MGVYIKNMEMPTDNTVLLRIFPASENGECYVQQLDVDGDVLAELWAVPVPPHGDLIDRDALMKILSKVIDINASIEQRNEATDQERRCLWWFEQQIGIAPTIISAEEGE